mmetsp:Transcript_63145/g.112730  ORF Transcript_63145/g.112730 Transcript_63145/m.112730 type:complete len:234 (+) Transcript_63145:540-1241(+)
MTDPLSLLLDGIPLPAADTDVARRGGSSTGAVCMGNAPNELTGVRDRTSRGTVPICVPKWKLAALRRPAGEVLGVRGVLAPDAGGVTRPVDCLGGFQTSLLVEPVGVPLGVPLGVPQPVVGVALPCLPELTGVPKPLLLRNIENEVPKLSDCGVKKVAGGTLSEETLPKVMLWPQEVEPETRGDWDTLPGPFCGESAANVGGRSAAAMSAGSPKAGEKRCGRGEGSLNLEGLS